MLDKLVPMGHAQGLLEAHPFGIPQNMKFVVLGILVGGVYLFKFGPNYSEDGVTLPKGLSDFSLLSLLPGKKRLVRLIAYLLRPLRTTRLGQYCVSLYCPPVASEKVLGGFFFGKTMITTAIAFYQVDSLALIMILGFSAVFDSLTGTYQHTLGNYFHRTLFKSKPLQFIQNLSKRFALDIIRAEIIMLLLLGSELLAGANQFHIFKNRLVSASYYFNAAIIDKLVEMGVISRNFRSRFVIVASTIGGMLCLLDFAKTKFPGWVPQEVLASIPSSIPGPLQLLMYFNLAVFLIMGTAYLITRQSKHMQSLISRRVTLFLLRMLSLLGNF